MATKNTTERINFASAKLGTGLSRLFGYSGKSFQDFFQLETKAEEREEEGLYKTFLDNFPITDTRNNFVLEFLDYFVDPPRYSIQECIERGLTYSVPLKARLKLILYRSRTRRFRNNCTRCLFRYNSLYDSFWYFCY